MKVSTSITQLFDRPLIVLVVLTALFIANHEVVFAQQAGVSISPALIEETLDPGFTKEYEIEIQNLDTNEQTFFLFTRNIRDVRPGGVPVFAREGDELTGMELSSWVELPISTLTLAGEERQTVRFTLNVPEDASPGGHFGGVFISLEPPEIENSGASVGYEVANIISIRVSGDVVEQASIRQFSTDRFIYGSQNIDFTTRIENAGNVLVRPFGPVKITNMLGQTVDTFMFNEVQSGVFPGKTREFKFDWQGQGVGFGRYEVELSAVYGEEGAIRTMTSTASYWVLPMNIIGPALGVLALLLLIVFVSVKLHINRTLARYSGGRTRVVRSRRRNGPSPGLLLAVVMLTVISLFLIVLLVLFA
jgi:hypothetical protein